MRGEMQEPLRGNDEDLTRQRDEWMKAAKENRALLEEIAARCCVEVPADILSVLTITEPLSVRHKAFSLFVCSRSGSDPSSCGLAACENGCALTEVDVVRLSVAERAIANALRAVPAEAKSPDDAEGYRLVRWAETYGDPEEWVKKAQAAHAAADSVAAELRHRIENPTFPADHDGAGSFLDNATLRRWVFRLGQRVVAGSAVGTDGSKEEQ